MKQTNSFTGDVEYYKCEKCKMVANYDVEVCPECGWSDDLQDTLENLDNNSLAE